MFIYFASTNARKLAQASFVLDTAGYDVHALPGAADLPPEIQGTPGEVIEAKTAAVRRFMDEHAGWDPDCLGVLVEDSSLHMDVLHGAPGADLKQFMSAMAPREWAGLCRERNGVTLRSHVHLVLSPAQSTYRVGEEIVRAHSAVRGRVVVPDPERLANLPAHANELDASVITDDMIASPISILSLAHTSISQWCAASARGQGFWQIAYHLAEKYESTRAEVQLATALDVMRGQVW